MKIYLTKNQYFILSILGQLSLVFTFLSALLFPLNNTYFIFQSGIAIFVIEILSLEATMIISKLQSQYNKRNKIGSIFQRSLILFIFAFFAIGISMGTQTFFPAFLFLISTATKIFSNKVTQNSFLSTFFKSFAFLGLAFLILLPIAFTYPFWEFIFPFPEQVFDYRLKGTSGLVDSPQTLLIWCMIYYTIMILIAFYHYKKQIKHQSV